MSATDFTLGFTPRFDTNSIVLVSFGLPRIDSFMVFQGAVRIRGSENLVPARSVSGSHKGGTKQGTPIFRGIDWGPLFDEAVKPFDRPILVCVGRHLNPRE